MIFKGWGKVILAASLCLICLFLNSSVWSAEVNLPLPADAIKIREKSFNIGPSRSLVQFYETSFSGDKLNAFYKREMQRDGWQQGKANFFKKDQYFVVLAIIPAGVSKEQKTRFSLATSSIPTKEEVWASRKVNPDQLDFMPIYPGSVQAFLWDLPTGVSASYETESDIKEVVFFYKSGMLNYGWQLYNETPITTKNIDCPECRKSILGALNKAQPNTANTSSKTRMVFRRGDGETCIISMFTILVDKSNLAQANPQANDAININFPGKTTILVTYNANKRINP